jgi:transcriptional regulator with XRE-family HTH domain
MDKVKKLIEAGATTRTAIKEALGMSVSDFAEKHRLSRPVVAAVLAGDRRASAGIIAALVAELGGTEVEWRVLLWEAARPYVMPEAEVA